MGLNRELSEMRKSIENLTAELHETNLAIRESLKITTEAINEMSAAFTKTLGDTIKVMQEMRVQIDVRDGVLKSLGIDGLIPDLFKKKT